MTLTPESVFKHMTPATLAAWVSDMDDAIDEMTQDDAVLMQAAVDQLFAIVGMEAIELLATYGIDEQHPLVAEAIADFNEVAA